MLPTIDVRDAAHAHVLMISDNRFNCNGRFFLSKESLWFSKIIETLRLNRKQTGSRRIKTRVLGSFGLNIAALFINPQIRSILPFVNKEINLLMDKKLE